MPSEQGIEGWVEIHSATYGEVEKQEVQFSLGQFQWTLTTQFKIASYPSAIAYQNPDCHPPPPFLLVFHSNC